jgi:hypothetical protein
MAACTQLRLASLLVGDLAAGHSRRDSEKHPARPGPSQGVEEAAQDPAADLPQSDNKHTTHSRATKQDP